MLCTPRAPRSRKALSPAAAWPISVPGQRWTSSRATTPTRKPASRSSGEPWVVMNKITEGKGNFGFNAQTEQFGDMVEMGVLDPTKVSRTALQNAASVAGLLLTTEAMVAELVEEKKNAGGHAHGMGGMGGMEGMDM